MLNNNMVRGVSIAVFVVAHATSVAAADDAARLTARDAEIVRQTSEGVRPKPCAVTAELLARVMKVVEAVSSAGKNTEMIKLKAAEGKLLVEKCVEPGAGLSPIKDLVSSLRAVAPDLIPRSLDDKALYFFTVLNDAASHRQALSVFRLFARFARTMLRLCLGEKVLESVVSATICKPPIATTSQSYSQATAALQAALKCSGEELFYVQTRLIRLNDLAKSTKSCSARGMKSRTIASLCDKYKSWFNPGSAYSICRIAVGEKP